MKKLITHINWRNFLQRTVLFLLLFIIIRLIVDWVEGDASLFRILRLSLMRYLTFAMVLGFLDSETWFFAKEKKEEEKVTKFTSTSSALFHYAGVAFFISLLCGFIFFIFFLIQWLVNYFTGKTSAALFPDWPLYLLVIGVLGIAFAGFEALRNYRNSKKIR